MTIFICFCFLVVRTQQYWDGEGNDGKWSNPLNWSNNNLPTSSTSVILNNIYVDSNYIITIDTLSGPLTLGSIEITPGLNKQIKLVLPLSNKFSPALSFTLPNSLVINSGGTVLNSSGASSGTIITLYDSVYIFNGGRYIHNTARAHASFVNLLSRKHGTEGGVFEFDVPNASSTVSLSDRVFGKLVFSSKSAGGSSNYTASGTRKVLVRSDLEIIQGARLNLNFTDTISVSGSLLMENAILNVSSGTRNLVVDFSGDLITDSNSIITETGTAFGKIVLSGKKEQLLDLRGKLEQQISLVINNSYGISLINPLIMQSTLELKKGRITTDHVNPLIITTKGDLLADSLAQDTFINGPVILQSQSSRAYSMVPVGRYGLLRWIGIKNWMGEIRCEFIRSDPKMLASIMNGVDHISSQGYWKVSKEDGSSVGGIELSFPDPNFSGVTDLDNLTIARLINSEWVGQEISSRKGSPGSNGSVLSEQLNLNDENYLTLASLVAGQNPLPINDQRIRFIPGFNLNKRVEIIKVISNGSGLVLNINSGINSMVEFQLYNDMGQIIYKQKIGVIKGNQNIYIKLPLQSPRIYHIFGLFWGVKSNTFTFSS